MVEDKKQDQDSYNKNSIQVTLDIYMSDPEIRKRRKTGERKWPLFIDEVTD